MALNVASSVTARSASDLAINLNFGCGQSFHKTAIGRPKLAASGIDSLNPEVSKVAFPGLTVTVSPVFRLHRGVFGVTEKLGSTSSISFGFVENSFAALSAGRSVRCSWHFYQPAFAGSSRTGCCFHISFSDLTCRISPERFSGQVENVSPVSSVERQVFFYPRFIGSIEDRGLGEMTLALCAFGRQQVSTTRLAYATLCRSPVILKRFATAFLVLRLDIDFGIGSREPILSNPVRNRKLSLVYAKRGRYLLA